MEGRTELLIIDPQFDFCDSTGQLYVNEAENDMGRVAIMIKRCGTKIKKIHVTLDCHYLYDIAHPPMWKNDDGKHPDPFTIITHQMVCDGIWYPVFAELPGVGNAREYAKEYTRKLEESGRYPLCIWPPHCLIGSDGNKVLPPLFEALNEWQKNSNNNVDFVSKGSNILTEHYSAVKAEVPDPKDPKTQLNIGLIETLKKADTILMGGEAGSHCVKNTVEDIADGFKDDIYIKKMVLLEDAVSPVQSPVVDFPAIQEQFITDMKARGMQIAQTTDF